MLIEITYNVTDVYMSTTETPVYVEISFEQPGGTSAVWGSITGTLSDQTDLQNALNAKLDESTIDGGTEGQILSKASATDFDFAWINNYAKYLATNVRNQSGSTIGAFQVVYISGATGNKPLISLADADTEATSSKTYGVTATAIANNGTGDVVTAGELSGINTSAFNEGDLLWLSTTAGGVVTTPPAEPAHAVFIGTVIRSHPTLGVIDVAIANGYELNELHGVQITSAANNDGLFYNSSNGLWENKTISTALGYTPVPTTRNITINGVTYDLSADRTYTISTGISGSGASGQVTYWTGASAVSGSNNLFWDNANGRLGIGTNAPSHPINIISSNAALGFRLEHASPSSASFPFQITTSDSTNYVRANINIIEFARNGGASTIRTKGSNNELLLQSFRHLQFAINDGTIAAQLYSTGNLVLQNGGTFSDGGQRLQVIGDTLLRGSGNTSATTALTVQNSDSNGLLTLDNGGVLNFGNLQTGGLRYRFAANLISYTNGVSAQSLTITTGPLTFSASVIGVKAGVSGATYHNIVVGGDWALNFSADASSINARTSFSPTSSNARYSMILADATINQTGGANGITRGLYVNPTLTAAADFRAIETTAGNVLFGSNFFWDNANGRLRINGSTSPLRPLEVFNSGNWISATFSGSGGTPKVVVGNLSGNPAIGGHNDALTGWAALAINPDGGNVLIGTSSNGSQKLQVVGDTLLRGSGATSATTALTVQNSSSTNLFTVLNDGSTDISAPGSHLELRQTNATSTNLTELYFYNTASNQSSLYFTQNNRTALNNLRAGHFNINGSGNGGVSICATNTGSFVDLITDGFASAAASKLALRAYDGNIGIGTTPTAALDVKASTTTAAAMRFRSGTAPTSPNDGDIWFDGTDIKMRIGGVTKTFTLV